MAVLFPYEVSIAWCGPLGFISSCASIPILPLFKLRKPLQCVLGTADFVLPLLGNEWKFSQPPNIHSPTLTSEDSCLHVRKPGCWDNPVSLCAWKSSQLQAQQSLTLGSRPIKMMGSSAIVSFNTSALGPNGQTQIGLQLWPLFE